mgnify:CR=1 FL=1
MNIMKTLPQVLREDYERYSKEIHNEGYENFTIKPDDALRAHYLIADYFSSVGEDKILYGIKTPSLLYSAIGRQEVSFAGKNKWNTPLEKCATLFYGLTKNHAFHDGNKRTSLLIALYNLHIIGRTPTENQKEFETLTKRIAANQLSKYKIYKKYKDNEDADVLTIAYVLKHLTKKTDKRFYAMTFKEFGQKIEKYGYYMTTPEKNFVKIYKKSNSKWKKDLFIRQIGCPSMSYQINEKAAKTILKDMGVEDNYNFFKGGEPLYKLIYDYRAPLLRLKDE